MAKPANNNKAFNFKSNKPAIAQIIEHLAALSAVVVLPFSDTNRSNLCWTVVLPRPLTCSVGGPNGKE